MLRHALPLALALPFALACGGDDEEPVSLSFAAVVGDAGFECGQTYSGLGEGGLDLTPVDLRFYVHDVRLVTADGDEVALAMDDDGRWQDGTVALLDFEDGCGDMGNPDLNATVTGTAPAGEYVGVRFRVGVPAEMNHADAATAGAPLNLTSMFWNWLGGYKFIRIDGESSAFEGWRLHLGSTACEGDMMGNASCATPNVVDVDLALDPAREAIVFDLAALVEGSTLANVEETPPGCMSAPSDVDCGPMFENLGLGFGGAGAGAQSVFRAGRGTP
ncbi:MAG TPA: metallo-mystery pair system four-Cys motif protein [Polyangiaceae bacterium LLY-WYZ-15_(1-7)]|nr:metallo-mystery pair system four-Cys motif protein [Polyangiaceae bacterium LLY-WYZ-15_(1-7)]HJL02941.1 metallo-mystery pair system four-Cys motif protein [Polyangiaceae bacterium LLY-WYZ-15_(1-7)]HJL13671.1 metallo-mystery pair system four-Cys motif protein [Polyangiaceae bacterium LLY-WYZ-15_(1-7)]HJL25851.1 metallo-mystery pair system four-Cys motif protein [Polyangiaceae bacterium LLY-WYZ-15_(1-7)]HJL49252.1 metallo-mystery pair system four-Cys motif protein [Polyangiaceae bacterium LLY-